MDDPLPSLRPLVVRVAVTGILFLLVPGLLVWLVPEAQDPVAIRTYVLGFGALAPLVFILLQSIQVLIVPIPAAAMAVTGGYLFGAIPGAVYSIVGTTVGSALAFALSRRYGRPYVSRLVGAERLARFDGFVERTGLPGVFLLFLIPGPWPDDVVCFIAGISAIRLDLLVVTAVAGRGPALVFASVVGANLMGGQALIAGLLLAILLIAWGVGYYYRRQIIERIARHVGPERVGE